MVRGGIEAQLMPTVDDGLGKAAHLLDIGDGRALAVDAPRDLRALRTAPAATWRLAQEDV